MAANTKSSKTPRVSVKKGRKGAKGGAPYKKTPIVKVAVKASIGGAVTAGTEYAIGRLAPAQHVTKFTWGWRILSTLIALGIAKKQPAIAAGMIATNVGMGIADGVSAFADKAGNTPAPTGNQAAAQNAVNSSGMGGRSLAGPGARSRMIDTTARPRYVVRR